jgi:DNA ligase (NAD+)
MVRIERAGDVIPEVVERVKQPGVKRKSPFSMPSMCPACGAEVFREGAYVVCPAGLACRPQQVAKIVHYGSKDALDIAGLGEETALALVEAGLVETVADLYDLTIKDLMKLDGFAEKSAGLLRHAIEGSKRPRLDRFVYGLGIRHVGLHVARVLARRFETLDWLREADCAALKTVGEIGPEIANSVRRFFREAENRKVLERLSEAGLRVQKMTGRKGDLPLEGKTVVLTGKLEDWTRSEAEALVEESGGRAASSVSGETDVVVAGKDPGRKLQEARDNGIEVLNEDDFKALIVEE